MSDNYELEDFEQVFGLELLGVVDLKGIESESDDPQDRVGDINANAPVEGYYLEAATDGDYLVSFLPEDYVVVRNDTTEVSVTEDTTGSDINDWFSADADGITVDGGGGDDILESSHQDVTLLGGSGDDDITALGDGAIVLGGEGDDSVSAAFATVDLGAGDDDLSMSGGGTAYGGDGDDYLSAYGDAPIVLYGDEGNDNLSATGTNALAYGGVGDDFLAAGNGGEVHGEDGDDHLQLDSGTTGFAGAGDDLISVWNQFRDTEGPAVVTTGDGADTIDARVWNASNGEADDIYLRVTDFDPDQDVLQVGVFQTPNDVRDVDIVEADDGSYTDVRVTYTGYYGQSPGIAVIRLEGTTGVTADQIVVTS
ncbi:calcium-binding protein [Phaeobacter marinintestinus]|uniref:calcium-binding protein n=1 Tax=Falsiphaeobacter marinintestinus TaxID=1492905 RepID=UPI0011B36F15|nr:hypothetical protein [Phaeobacter marinintestinus]